MTCPVCGTTDVSKVIYLGFPMRMCERDDCVCVFGFWSFIMEWMPIPSDDGDGEPAWKFLTYDGWYPVALWVWLRGCGA